jgi:DNA-binding transcriptional ArsR family regulator
MKQKYDPHIRVRFDLFDDPQFRTIPKNKRSNCFSVLCVLLKYVSNVTRQCYPRIQTICNTIGLGRTSVYLALVQLEKVGIITKKRLSSSVLYTIAPQYIVGIRNTNTNIRNTNIRYSDYTDINKSNINLSISNITKVIKEVVDKGGDQSKVISTLASTLTADTLKKAIKENDNIFYSKLALKEQSEKRGKLVDIPRNIVDNVRKKTHFGYQSKVSKTKRDYDRKIKSKDLLRSDSKDKW